MNPNLGWSEARKSPANDFADFLDIILPARNGRLAVLNAYFDASSRTSGIFSLAGVAFAKPQVKKFDKEWWKLFGQYGGCHMNKLTHGKGGFKGLDTAQTGELLKQATKIINKRISFGVVVSCDLAEINALLPRWIRGFEHAYPVCCHVAMFALGSHVSKFAPGEQIAYLFETGDPYSGAAHSFIDQMSKAPETKTPSLYYSHSFIEKKDALALQAADILAWEWGKYWDETVTARKRNLESRKMRKSLIGLIARNNEFYSDRYKFTHLTGGPLQRWTRQVGELGLSQIQEDQAKTKQPSAASSSQADE